MQESAENKKTKKANDPVEIQKTFPDDGLKKKKKLNKACQVCDCA